MMSLPSMRAPSAATYRALVRLMAPTALAMLALLAVLHWHSAYSERIGDAANVVPAGLLLAIDVWMALLLIAKAFLLYSQRPSSIVVGVDCE